METIFANSIWIWLDRGSVLLSYAVLISFIAFLFDLWKSLRKSRRLAEVAGETNRPRALALSHGGGSIRADVEAYLKRAYPGKKIELDEHVEGELTPNRAQKVIKALKEYKENYQMTGVTELHLFMKTTTAISTAAGAIFDNWKAVKIYQLDRNTNEYQPWLVLSHAKTFQLEGMLEESAIQLLDRVLPNEHTASNSSSDIASSSSPSK